MTDIAQEIVILLAVAVTLCSAYSQTVTVKGQLMCGGKPATSKDTWVSVMNKRLGSDDKNEVSVNDDGTFENTLSVSRTFGVTPEVHIYTDCNDAKFYGAVQKGCQRKIVLKIPSKYVSTSGKATAYDLGTKYNLEAKTSDEERDCSIHRTLSG